MHFRTAAFWDDYEYPFTYPAPLAVLYAALYTIPHVLRFYLTAYAAATVAASLLMRRVLIERGMGRASALAFTIALFALNYPPRTLFESANTEGIVAILTAFGVFYLLRDRCYLGGALIAVAGTLKIFPFILLALLLSKRRYREFALAIAFAVNGMSLAIVGPTIAEASRRIASGIHYVQVTFIYSVNPAAVTFNHSLFTLVKFAVVALATCIRSSFAPTRTGCSAPLPSAACWTSRSPSMWFLRRASAWWRISSGSAACRC